MKIKIKKVLALLLSLSLVLATFGDFAQVKAADSSHNVTLKRLKDVTLSGDDWVLYIETEGYEYSNVDWDKKYDPFTIVVNGVEGTTGQVSCTGETNLLYCTIPTSLVPNTNGTTFTIKAGTSPSQSDHSDEINIISDFQVAVVDSNLVHTTVFEVGTATTLNDSAGSFYFDLKDKSGNAFNMGYSSWDYYLAPSLSDGSGKIAEDKWNEIYTGVWVDGSPLDAGHFKNCDPGRFYIDGLNATNGTKITIKGHFVSVYQGDHVTTKGHYYLPEFSFTFNGTTWEFSKLTEYTNVTLTGTVAGKSVFNAAINGWELYLTNTGITDGSWAYKYKGLRYIKDGNEYRTSQVSTSDPGFSYALYCSIPSSVLPSDAADGTEITIKADTYDWDDAHAYQGIAIQKDLTLIIQNGQLVPKITYVDYTGTPTNASANSTSGFNFSVPEATDFPYFTDWSKITVAQDGENNGVLLNGEKTNVFLKKHAEDNWYVCLSDAGVSSEIKIGDLITLKGTFTYTDEANFTVHRITFKETIFQWDGTNYNPYEIEYTEHTGTPTYHDANTNEPSAGFYFIANENKFPYDKSWGTFIYAEDDANSGVFLNDKKTSIPLKKVDSELWYMCVSDGLVTPQDGDIFTIKGSFVVGTDRITFSQAKFIWNDSQYKAYVESVNYTGTPVLSAQNESYGTVSGFYFTSEDGAPCDTNWNLWYQPQEGDSNGVFVGDKKYEIGLQKVNTNLWYANLTKDSNLALANGDVVTIKGAFKASSGEVVTFNEAKFQFNGKQFSEGTFTATDFTITGLAYSDIVYDTASGRWNMYFTLSTNIPGDVDGTYYPYMTYEIDGTEYTGHWFKSSYAHTVNGETIYNLFVPITQLPKTLNREYAITIKTGASQGRQSGSNVAREDGINLTKDYQFTVGGDYQATAPTIDYLESTTGGTEKGIHLASSDDFPTLGWDYVITKVGAEDGVYKLDEETNEYVATDVYIKKFSDNKYYVSLSDKDVAVEEGTVIMLRGTFTIKNLNFITFKTAKYIYQNGAWKVYSDIQVETGTGVSGDADRNGKLNSADLVRMKKFLDDSATIINLSDADLNGSGKIDVNDIVIVRKLLVGLELYKGAPTYADNVEMRLAAYVSPTVEEGFDDYKAAGFTTLISEQKAVYGTDGFEEYMNLAAEKGLDVLVQSGVFQNMLTDGGKYDAAWIENMYNDLKQYSSFRGMFMGDEPRISYLSNYEKVTNALKQIAPEIDLFTSCLQTYTNEDYLSTNSTLSLEQKYAEYANSYGNLFGEFTYDFYPFRHSYKTFLGAKYNEKDYMRSDWFNNLNLVASNAKGSYDTGITVQSYSEDLVTTDHYREVTQADVSFQVYSALAYGMKSINYFTYGTHWDEGVGTTSCMVYNGQKTDTYYAVQNVNKEIKALDHILLNYNWQGTIGKSGDNADGIMNYVANYTSPRISASSATNDAIIGCLKDQNGYDGFMLVNATDPSDKKNTTVSVTFNDADYAKVYIGGVESIVELTGGAYTATLTPGQGIFVIPYIAE